MLGKYLDISTSHLKEETLNSLSENKMPYSYDYKEGIFISVPDKDIIGKEIRNLPSDLVVLLEYAWENDVLLIRLDTDGEVVDDLPVYEWDEVKWNGKFLGGDYMMTDKELIKAKEILKENHINARPIEFWEGKDYYKVAYTTYAGNFYIKGFGK